MKNLIALSLAFVAIPLSFSQCLTISCPSDITQSNDAGNCSAIINYSMPVVNSTCLVSEDFNYTGAKDSFIVPAGVNMITIETHGAQGGANWTDNVNFGGYAKADFQVTPGQVLYVYVGQQPSGIAGGYNGGGSGEGAGQGGGGASDVRLSGGTLNDRIIVAGGGGGAGYWSNLHVVGGVGGGLTGGDGYRNTTADMGGQGGNQSASGTGTCVTFNNPAVSGGFGYGGSPSGCGCEGYGGGGGWYGGAGSGNCRGGGGGSGYILAAATNQLFDSGTRAGNGFVKISWYGTSTLTPTLISGLPSGSAFPAGMTTVQVFALNDGLGNADTCQFSVTITDDEPPVPNSATLPDITGSCSATVTVTPTATDNCGGQITATTTDQLSYSSQGTYQVQWNYTDAEGNSSTQLQNIIVDDVTAPVITSCPSDMPVCAGSVVTFDITASDDCGAANIQQTSGLSSGSIFPAGTHLISYLVTDAENNSSSCSFTITAAAIPDNSVNATPSMLTASATGVTYQWINCADNQPVANAVSQSFSTAVTGDYAVIVSDAGCSDTSACFPLINTTGIPGTANFMLELFPNPATELVSVMVHSPVKARLINATGKIIRTLDLQHTTLMNISALESGVYYIVTDNGAAKSFIKL